MEFSLRSITKVYGNIKEKFFSSNISHVHKKNVREGLVVTTTKTTLTKAGK